ncbi:MAG: hypothetical protein CMJ81_19030 [Planctomycetaceae bacterium]|nr:hypothetical protein [Planctomycetaceae bacterium]MBP62666.1 hypothetical protein [Planctomycetaceae bacterium]
MKQFTRFETLALVFLISIGVGLRLSLYEIPNFAPVAAIALFSGFFFRHWTVAVSVPLLTMAISDAWIGGYHLGMMLLVYGMLALPVTCRGVLRRLMTTNGALLVSSRGTILGVAGCGLVASILFFVVTNLGHWYFYDYPRTFAGLGQCYLQAIPFFRYTLCGDLLFGLTLFGVYGFVSSRLALPGRAVRV